MTSWPPQTEYRLDGLYYCYADPVIGPVLPGVHFNLPDDSPDIHEGGFWNVYPQPKPTPIETVPVVAQGGGGCEVLTQDELAEAYRRVPGVPFYDTMDPDQGPGCDWADQSDPWGDLALDYGIEHYQWGFALADPQDRRQRVEHFQIAEILYRHAAGRGNVQGWVNLGYIYAYHRCEGRDFRSAYDRFASAYGLPERPDEKRLAFLCFDHAARRGSIEGAYKLGDMYARGTGCERDAAKAFEWFAVACEGAEIDGDPRLWGSASLRLAEARARGKGCPIDHAKALGHYRDAVRGLKRAVAEGQYEYERVLASAEDGVRDMLQELALEHDLAGEG